MSFLVRLCTLSYGIKARLNRAMSVGLNGVWLALLNREDLHAVSSAVYSKRSFYQTPDYNRRGLWEWETRAINEYFASCSRLLVAAAGGGREVLALRKRGFAVDGFEAHPGLVHFANEFLQEEGHGNGIQLAPWDGCPEYQHVYDGVIIGWGAYMHIRGKSRRVALLRALRQRVKEGSPILLSFATMEKPSRMMSATTWLANALARPLGRERVELGDWLEPAFTHYFTRHTLAGELRDAGFEMKYFATDNSDHAVGIAVDGIPE